MLRFSFFLPSFLSSKAVVNINRLDDRALGVADKADYEQENHGHFLEVARPKGHSDSSKYQSTEYTEDQSNKSHP